MNKRINQAACFKPSWQVLQDFEVNPLFVGILNLSYILNNFHYRDMLPCLVRVEREIREEGV